MTVSAAIWVASTLVEGNARFALWGLAILVEIAIAFVPQWQRSVATIPFHLEHLPERFGLFTIIVLGETVLAVVIGVAETDWDTTAAAFAAVGLTISFSLWWVYFETVNAEAMHHPGGFRPIGWMLAHAPLVIGITALGVGIELATLTELGEPLSTNDALVLAGSLSVALAALGLIGAADEIDGSWVAAFLRRLPAAVLVLAVGFLPIAAQAVLVGLALIAGTQAIFDVRASHRASMAAEV